MFTSENDRLEKINRAHLMLIGYLSRTIETQDVEIAALKNRLRAKPVHGQELEAEIGRLKDINKRQDETIGELERKNEDLQDEIAILTKSILAMNGRLPPFVTEPATDDTSNLRELQDLQRAKDEAERSTTPAIGITEESRRFWKGDSRDLKSRLDKPAVRKVLRTPVMTAARRAANQQLRREDGMV